MVYIDYPYSTFYTCTVQALNSNLGIGRKEKKFKHMPLNSDIAVRVRWKSGVCMMEIGCVQGKPRARKIEEEKNRVKKCGE